MLRFAAALAAAALVSSAALAQTVSLAARTPLEPEPLDRPRCRFTATPELVMTQKTRPNSTSSAVYSARSRESSGRETKFTASISESETVHSWRGILMSGPAFVIDDERFASSKVTRATVTLDGRAFDVPILVHHGVSYGDNPFSTVASVMPALYPDQDQWFARLDRGSVAVVYLTNERGTRFGPWTFDVGTFRNIPDAIKGSGFRCS